MKTLQTLFASALTAIVLSATVLNSNAAEKIIELKTSSVVNPDIKKVIVTGNTRVFLVQSKTEWVSADQEDLSKISVKQIGNTLRINSDEKYPVTVTVYVKDLFRIDASNNVMVKTVGKFDVKFLQVMLRDHATARVKTNTESLYTVIDGQASLELLGSTGKHIVKTNGVATLNTEKFAAVTTSRETMDGEMAMNAELADAEAILAITLAGK